MQPFDVTTNEDIEKAMEMQEEIAEPHTITTPDTSDGYHTFRELYRYRMLYNACLFNEWSARDLFKVHKSRRHFDGQLCFDGEYFVVVAQLPAGQITNHYQLEYFDLFRVPERIAAAEWDGHTPNEAADRLEEFLRHYHL